MNKGIAVAGVIIMDIIKLIETLPTRHGLTHISGISSSLGGAVCNTAVDLAVLDPALPVKAVGLVGVDAEGDEVLRRMGKYPNMDLSRIRRAGKTAFTDVLTEEESRARTFLVYNESNDMLCQEHIDIPALNCDIFHIGYILLLKKLDEPDAEYGTKMARLLHDIQAAGILTSVDVVSEVGNRYAQLVPPSLKYTDYFIVNEIESGKTVGIDLRGEDGCLLTERIPEVLRRIKSMGVRRWAVIHTPEGGFGMDENGEYFYSPGLSLPDGYIKGTVGAGDAFCAGVLYTAYKGQSLGSALDDANAAAACSLRAPGATEGMLPIADVRALAGTLGG